MAKLNLHRRHLTHCIGHHKAFSRSYEADELRRGWKRCRCPIYASGTLGREHRRFNTDQDTWQAAKIVEAVWLAADSFDAPVAPAAFAALKGTTAETEAPTGTTIEHATRIFLAECENRGLADSTLRKHQTVVKQFIAYSSRKGYAFIGDWTVQDVRDFRASWNDGVRAGAKKLERVRALFEFCLSNEWVNKNVAAPVKPPKGASIPAHKSPFTDEELARIFSACDSLPATNWSNGSRTGIWTGQDVKDFIDVLCYTGLRISDVAKFDMQRLNGNDCFLFMHKTGKPLFTWLPNWLRDRLRERAIEWGSRVFATGESERLETMTDLWRRKINRVFALAGEWEEPPTPHRFRHTFARMLLRRGVPVPDVAELIGDTEDMVRRHYARWVPERQARLTSILKRAFGDDETPGRRTPVQKTGTDA